MSPLPFRSTIERAVEALIDLLDEIDGDAEREVEDDAGADDFGEPAGQNFADPVSPIRKPTQ